MPTYCALVFEGTKLVDSSALEADDLLEAIQSCSNSPRFRRVEIWADGRRLATLPSMSEHHPSQSQGHYY